MNIFRKFYEAYPGCLVNLNQTHLICKEGECQIEFFTSVQKIKAVFKNEHERDKEYEKILKMKF